MGTLRAANDQFERVPVAGNRALAAGRFGDSGAAFSRIWNGALDTTPSTIDENR
jgi:hypothetical protein